MATPSLATFGFATHPGVATEMKFPGAGLPANPPPESVPGEHPEAVAEIEIPRSPDGVVHCPNQAFDGTGMPEG